MKILSLKVPASLDAELEAAASRRGTTKSALLREALTSYLGQGAGEPRAGDVREPAPPPYGDAEEPAEPSFLSLAGDLAGCLEGPEDLSTNPEHLRGFGH